MSDRIDKVKDEVEDELRKYVWQLLGAAALIIAYCSTLAFNFWPSVVFLVIALVITSTLSILKKDTVSQWIQRQFFPQADLVILIGTLPITGYYISGGMGVVEWPFAMLLCIEYAVMGHLFWGKQP